MDLRFWVRLCACALVVFSVALLVVTATGLRNYRQSQDDVANSLALMSGLYNGTGSLSLQSPHSPLPSLPFPPLSLYPSAISFISSYSQASLIRYLFRLPRGTRSIYNCTPWSTGGTRRSRCRLRGSRWCACVLR
jgi:hypothetical protein